jgi:hypothetical protein
LIEEVKKRLERNPTDLQLRFELGEHFVSAQRFREAVPELQRSATKSKCAFKSDESAWCLLSRARHAGSGNETIQGGGEGDSNDGWDEKGNRLQPRDRLGKNGRAQKVPQLHETNLRS